VTVPRAFPAFAIVFAAVYAIVYVICVEQNYALFSYHPAIKKFGMGVQEPLDGPVMYWYGWMATSALAATITGLIAASLPQAIVRRLWPGWSWLVPVCVMVVFCYLLRKFFLQ
jgi:hypothetical protein